MERRRFVELAGALAAVPLLGREESRDAITRPIPSSGERIPVIGMGTWLTFDVGRATSDRTRLRAVLQTFFDRGGRLIDSSPMYGRSGSASVTAASVNPRPSALLYRSVTPGEP